MKCPADIVLACDRELECKCGFCRKHCVCTVKDSRAERRQRAVALWKKVWLDNSGFEGTISEESFGDALAAFSCRDRMEHFKEVGLALKKYFLAKVKAHFKDDDIYTGRVVKLEIEKGVLR